VTAAVITRPPDGTGAPRRRRVGRWLAVLAVVSVLGFVVVIPARTWVDQNLAMRDATAELERIERTNRELSDKIQRLSQDDAIERQAREQFGLVYPGEEPYTVLDPGAATVNLPRVWPFDRLQDPLARAAARQGVADEEANLDRDLEGG
jgi:cell division protein FtsB